MSELQLKELGHRLTGLKITSDISEATHLNHSITLININLLQLKEIYNELYSRGFSFHYLNLQALLHEVAHYKQFLKHGKNDLDFFSRWHWRNYEEVEKIADRYALMYYKRFVKEFV